MKKGIEGLVGISFCVSEKGELSDFSVIRSIGYGCEEAMIAAIKGTKWKPGFSNSRPIKMKLEVNINFSLE